MKHKGGVVVILTAFASAGALGCWAKVKHDERDAAPLLLPDRDQFRSGGVGAMMEKRCGSLDCHGQDARPLRIYSQNGLRRDFADGGLRDRRPTTPTEQNDNYSAVVGLEPEELAESVSTRGEYTSFQLLLKPLDVSGRGVRHKGGPVLRATESDPGWACLHGWIAGDLDPKRCTEAIE